MHLYFANDVSSRGVADASLLVPHLALPYFASMWSNPAHVLVTNAEGDFVADTPPQFTAAREKITCMAWHPAHLTLCIGWEGGRLSVWSLHSLIAVGMTTGETAVVSPQVPVDVDRAPTQHGEQNVTACAWSSSGAYFLTASNSTRVVVWAVDNSSSSNEGNSGNIATVMRSTFTPLWSVETETVVTYAVCVVPIGTSSLLRGLQKKHGQKPISWSRGISQVTPAHSSADDDDNEDCVFILSSFSGKHIFALNEGQKLFSLFSVDEPTMAVVYNAPERFLALLSASSIISVYHISDTMDAKLLIRRKLSTPTANITPERFTPTMQWVSPSVLAFGSGDNRVRFFDIHNDRIFVLPHPATSSSHITHITTLEWKGLLAVTTAEGSVAVFQRSANEKQSESTLNANANAGNSSGIVGGVKDHLDPSTEWDLVTVLDMETRADRVSFTVAGHIVVALSNGKLVVLRETLRNRAWDGVVAATQISTTMVVVESITGCQCLLKSTSKICGISVAFPIIGLWNGQQIDLYTVNESTSTASLTNIVSTTSPAFAVHSEGIFFVKDDNRVMFANFQLTTVGQLSFTEAEGIPILVDVMGDIVVAVSSNNAMRVARVNGREVRSMGPPRQLPLIENGIVVTVARVNAQGRRVAFMARRVESDQLDSRIWVYDCDTDQMSSYDFAVRSEMPDAVYWNTPEPNGNTIGELGFLLLACETHQVKSNASQQQLQHHDDEDVLGGNATRQHRDESSTGVLNSEGALSNEALPDLENFAEKQQRMENERFMSGFSGVNPLANRTHSVVTLFATNKGLVVHNAVVLQRYHICLIGLTIPDFLLASVRINGNPSNPEDYMIEQKRLRDFEGLKTEKDAAVLEALMKFSYYSTIGNMDEAYRCVKTIKSSTVWQNLAKMCVFSGRLDVAEVCLAQMQDGVAARSLREARVKYPTEKEVQLATLACSLGLVKESEAILRKAKRYDLVTDLLLACGKFEQAQRHTKQYDRIRAHYVAYKYAQFMESFSNFEAAIIWYFNAKCLSTDVVRIYFQNNRLGELRELVLPSTDDVKDDGLGEDINSKKSSVNAPNGDKSAGSGGGGTVVEVQKRESKSLDTLGAAVGDTGNSNPDAAKEEAKNSHASLKHLFLNNKDLILWWARYSERRQELDEAVRFYMLAEDSFNAVRLLCLENPPKIEMAVEIVDKELEKARTQANRLASALGMKSTASTEVEPVGAAFFVGLHFERAGDVSKAVQYYKYANAWRSAARVTKGRQLLGELLSISLMSDDHQLMLSSANFLEHNNAYDKAVELYHRVGNVRKAIDICIKGGLYDTMHKISTTLDAHSDPEVFLQMATHFVESGHYTKAAEMYVFARSFPSALELCSQRGVVLTDEMAEAITSDTNRRDTKDEKWSLLQQVAAIARDQGSWNLACKKYTQLGERLKAMKMLMRGGDVEKVIFFANHSRNAEIYTLAGNFLQSQNFHTDANIHKHIVLFYTKAKAFGNLISYAESYAQLQIDESRNYHEAWSALNECVQVLERHADEVLSSNNMTGKERLISYRDIVGLVVKAAGLLSGSANDAANVTEFIALCSDLIKRSRPGHNDHAAVTSAIRIGDVFGLLVRHYSERMQSSKDALRVIESMVKHDVEPCFFVERDLLEKVCAANGRNVAEFIKGEIETHAKDGGDNAT